MVNAMDRVLNMESKRVLVTGGAGFLGSHLCNRLVDQGNDVICVDNLYTGSKSNIATLLGEPNFDFIRHDITFPIYLEVDQIYNLACPASPIHYQSNPVQTTKTSVHGAINVLGLAKRTRARIFQASTSEVYGDPEVHPQPENYLGRVNPIGVRACYDEGKRCAETLFFDYHRQHGIEIKIARIFNTYGPRMSLSDGRVVSNFILQALKNEPITIYGDGSQIRDWLYVEDHAKALIKVVTEGEIGETYNIGGHNEKTNLEVVENICDLLEELASNKPKEVERYRDLITFVKDRPGHDARYAIDASKIQRELGWVPEETFETGLRKTVQWYLDNCQWWERVLSGAYRLERLGE